MITCAFGGCDVHENLARREHIPTGETHHYCDDHAPEGDGETWRMV